MVSKVDNALKKSLVDSYEQRADISEQSLGKEATMETPWGEAVISSGVPEVAGAKEDLRRQIADATWEEEGFLGTLGNAITAKAGMNKIGSVGYKLYLEHIADTERDVDPNFDALKELQEDSMLYDSEDREFLSKAVDKQDYDNRKSLLEDRAVQEAKLQAMGGYGVATSFLAGAVDLDMFLPSLQAYKLSNRVRKMQGALKYGKTTSEIANAKRTILALKAQRAALPAANAAAQNIALETIGNINGEDTDIDDIINAGIIGAGFGTVFTAGAAVLGKAVDAGDIKANRAIVDTLLERNGKLTWGEKMDILDMTETPVTTLDSVAKAKEQIYVTDNKGNIKSRKKLREVSPDAPEWMDDIKASDSVKDIIAGSYLSQKETQAARAKAYGLLDENDKKLGIVLSEKVETGINTILGRPVYNQAQDSGNVVLAAVTHDLVADPTNYVSNINNAEAITDLTRTRAISFLKEADDVDYTSWLNKRIKGIKDKGELFKAKYLGSLRSEFTDAIELEINARELGIKDSLSSDPDISAYADKIERIGNYLLDELQDTAHAGKNAVRGSESLQKGAYIKRRWDGYKLAQSMGKYGDEAIENAFTESVIRGYGYKGLTIDETKARIFARAILKNATKPTTTKKFTMSETRDELFTLLKENTDLPEGEINKLIDGITQRAEERGKPNFSKYRIPMDYSVELPDGTKVVSLLDRDIQRTVTGHINNASGRVGLARVGFTSDAKFEEAVRAAELIDMELKKRGNILKVNSREYLEDFRAQLLGYPVSNESPWAARLINTGNLFMMNQAGLTQVVEFAPQLAAFGMTKTFGNIKDAINALAFGKNTDLLDEINLVAGRAFFDDYNVSAFNANNIELDNLPKDHWFWNHYDYLLKQGLTKQQSWNLMKPVMLVQRLSAYSSLVNQLYKVAKEGSFDKFRARLSDWGITDEFFDRIQKYMKDTAVLDNRGKIQKLELSKWDYDTREEFLRAAKRAVDTVVQKPRLGEQRKWISSGMGRLIGQYKTYPLLAASKYTVRGLRHLDAESFNTFLWSLALAPLIYIAKVQATTADEAERRNKLTVDKVIYNALSYNVNLSSFVEPISALGELIGIKTSPYSQGNFQAAGYIAPSLNVLPVLAAPFKAVGQSVTREDGLNRQTFKQLQQATVIGNMLGVARFYEAVFGAPLTRDAKKIKKSLEEKTAKVSQSKKETKQEQSNKPDESAKDTKGSSEATALEDLQNIYVDTNS